MQAKEGDSQKKAAHLHINSKDDQDADVLSLLLFVFLSILLIFIVICTDLYAGVFEYRNIGGSKENSHARALSVASTSTLPSMASTSTLPSSTSQSDSFTSRQFSKESPVIEPSPVTEPSPGDFSECKQVQVGGSCCPATGMDLLLLLDSSSSVPEWDYRDFARQLAKDIAKFPPNTRLGILLFASLTEIVFNFDTPRHEWAEKIKNIRLMAGATWTHRALSEGYANFIKKFPSENEKRVILITDGSPSLSQEPCTLNPTKNSTRRFRKTDMGKFYKDHNVELRVITIGDNLAEFQSLECLGKTTRIDDWESDALNPALIDVVLDQFLPGLRNESSLNQCLNSRSTPYDGLYQFDGSEVGGKPSFVNENDMITKLEGSQYVFQDPINDLDEMKLDGEKWNLNGEIVDPRICCIHQTNPPTQTPTTAAEACADIPDPNDDEFIIHQTFKTSDREQWPEVWPYFYDTWTVMHPKWRHFFWTDKLNRKLVRCYYPSFMKKYQKANMQIKRADMIRWVYLWVYGGLYVDMDYLPLKSHEHFLKFMDEQNADILLSYEKKYGTAMEWALAKKKQHPLWTHCIEMNEPNKLYSPEIATGPAFMKKCVNTFGKRQEAHSIDPGLLKGTTVYILEENYVSILSWYTYAESTECKQIQELPSNWFRKHFDSSECYAWLMKNNAYALTTYSASWHLHDISQRRKKTGLTDEEWQILKEEERRRLQGYIGTKFIGE